LCVLVRGAAGQAALCAPAQPAHHMTPPKPHTAEPARSATLPEDDADEAALLGVVVQLVRQSTQVDLSHYKDSTFRRQLDRRMLDLGCATLDDYVTRLHADGKELHRLQRSLLISVTRFFRDAEVFERIARVIQDLAAAKPDGEPLRIWVPGCATGEEAYSLAILLVEALGERLARVPIRLFATDIDEAAVAVARQGLYPLAAIEALPAELVARHFVQDEDGVRLSRQVRELCVFAQHDLLNQPPFVNLDLLSCRNVMIYFQPRVQAELLAKFHYALRPHAWLVLGQSESVGAQEELFTTQDKSGRLYRKRAVPTPRQVGLHGGWRQQVALSAHADAPHPSAATTASRFHLQLLQRDALPSALVNAKGQVMQLWGDVDRYLRLGGGSDFSLASLCLPDLRADVRGLMHLAITASPAEMASQPIALNIDGEPSIVRVRAQALRGEPGDVQGVVVSFDARGTAQPLGSALPGAALAGQPDVQALQADLAVAREQLHAMVAQLERSHDERQSLHEELQASSEELQSSNEELQASNEELSTLNEQLMAKSDELSGLNDLLLNIENSVQLAMVVVDTQMRVQRFNPLAVRVFGIMEHDIGRPLAAVPSSLPLDELPAQIAQVLRTGQYQVSRIDQGDRHYVMQLSPLRDVREQLTGVIIGFTDVAELRLAEAERARLAAIVTHSEDAIVGKTLDGIITSWNPGAERLFGHTADEAVGQPMLMAFPPELKDEEAVLLARVGRGESVPAFDTVRLRKDGGRVHVSVALSPIRDAAGRIIGVSKIARDITERVADEAVRSANLQRLEQLVQARTRELADKEQYLQSILEGMPGLVAYWGADLRLQYSNQQHRIRLSRDKVNGDVGFTMQDILGPERFEHARRHVARVLQGEVVEFEVGPVQDPAREGDSFYQVNYMPDLRDGQVAGFIAMGFDITTVKHAEAAAEAASRAKSEFLANMSHEIRTPLNAVLGLAQVAQRQHSGQPVAETFTHILQAGQHLLGVINDVLDFSKIEAGKLDLQVGRVDITELIDKAVGMVSGLARAKGLSLRVTRDPLLAEAYAGDPVRIAQLLINLLNNAVKFTDSGKVELMLRVHQGGVAMLVSDTGPGMSADVQARLFKPFEQGDGSSTRKVGGTGLGLSICRRLADLMQGRIEVRSQPGQGADFEVWLPLLPMLTHHVGRGPAHGVAGHALPGTVWRPRLQGVHVLVAEDHPINQLVLQQLLQAEGASQSMVANGAMAVDAVTAALAGTRRAIDVLLCDIEMPVMDGYEATRRIRELSPELPIIGLTAHAFDDARRRGEAVGMSDYLTKPYMVEDLVLAIQQLLPDGVQALDVRTRADTLLDIPPGMRLDRQALATHYHTVPGFIPSLLAAVHHTCETQPALLDAALAAGQVEVLRHLAHGVMGVAANLLLPDLRDLAQALQEAASQDWAQAGPLVARLKAGLGLLYRQLGADAGAGVGASAGAAAGATSRAQA